ncbi:MFS general substrate transporter, partial [Thozetella sp. PMI_491]
GVLNLLVTSWFIKQFGVRAAMIQQCIWPAVRAGLQVLAIGIGGNTGINIIIFGQFVCILGGSQGYVLVANTYVTKLVKGPDQTGVLGVLQGFVMFGTAFGYLLGGVVGDWLGIGYPFYFALAFMIVSTIYALVFLPFVTVQHSETEALSKSNPVSAIIRPLQLFVPVLLTSPEGRTRRFYHIFLLGWGVFFGVLATGFIPIIIQLYSTSAFDFHPTQNGYLMAFNYLMRGSFLAFIFPWLISKGRKWYNGSEEENGDTKVSPSPSPVPAEEGDSGERDDIAQASPSKGYITGFDLLFVKISLLLDGILTCSAAFSTQPWHIYTSAFLIPLASGSAPAAKGVIIEMCSSSQREDALTAISLAETVATLLTMSIFGKVYAILAERGTPYQVFFYNAAVALFAAGVLAFCRFPPASYRRLEPSLA